MDFNSHTDAVVEAAVELVNELTEGERRGRPYLLPTPADRIAAASDVLRGLRPERPRADAAEAEELAAVARDLRAVFEGVAAGDLDAAAEQVNRLLDDTRARPRLERHDGEPWHVHFHGDGGTLTAEWAAPCATGLAIVLGGDFRDRLGVCTAPRCDRVYVDTSRNGTRRFCSTACQNRVKTAAFRARAQSGG
ncbi:CGNR zinc finger domain-containing protein [Spirillospora sp. NPDC052242]